LLDVREYLGEESEDEHGWAQVARAELGGAPAIGPGIHPV